jgi:hypothetical protein
MSTITAAPIGIPRSGRLCCHFSSGISGAEKAPGDSGAAGRHRTGRGDAAASQRRAALAKTL